MKIITFFKTSLSSGGAEHQLAFLANELVLKGYDINIVTFADLPDHYSISDKIHRVRLAPKKSNFIKALSIISFFTKIKTDVVICFGQRESLILLPILLFRPSIIVFSGERSLTLNRPTRKEWILFNYLYRRSDYIIPNSIAQGKLIASFNKRLSPKIFPIINYTDLDEYSFQVLPNNVICRIGVFARFHKAKNYKRFADAMTILQQQYNYRFVVDWYGSIHLKGSLSEDYLNYKKTIIDNKMEDYIHLHDHVKDITKLISSFDVMCLPSIYEGFSNSLAEYICCGRPVLASDVSDNSYMVHNGENGFLFDPMNIQSIVDAFLKFFSLKKEERSEMGRKSREIAEVLFVKDKFVDSYVNLIESRK